MTVQAAAEFDWLTDSLAGLRDSHLLRPRREVHSLVGGRCRVDGRELLNFAANDYLDLAADPRVRAAAAEAAGSHGAGAGASPLVTGRTTWHARLERVLADFEGHESAVLFPSGYAANVGTLRALLGPEDVVFSDRLNHASLIDGCRLCRARVEIHDRHRLDRLAESLAAASDARRRLIVTDGLFSMDGELAPLESLCDLADEFDAGVLVDEAHGTGVLGARGRGAAEALGVADRVSVRVGTLSKALGAQGGFVTGSNELVDWLWNTGRTQVFSTALSPTACAAAAAAIEIVIAEPDRRIRLAERSEQLRAALLDAGLADTAADTAADTGPIVPVIVGEPDAVVEACRRLDERGFLVAAIRPPTVAVGTSRLRISLSAAHTVEDVAALATAVAETLDDAGLRTTGG